MQYDDVYNQRSKSAQSFDTYLVNFNIFFETTVGESLAVVGSINELGNWKDIKVHLKWTTGHIWRSTEPIIVRNQ